MRIKPIRSDLVEYLKKRNLARKWLKAKRLFEADIRHPSLEVELMEPRWRGIYSFRIDKKFRALFFVDGDIAEVFKITNHYRK